MVKRPDTVFVSAHTSSLWHLFDTSERWDVVRTRCSRVLKNYWIHRDTVDIANSEALGSLRHCERCGSIEEYVMVTEQLAEYQIAKTIELSKQARLRVRFHEIEQMRLAAIEEDILQLLKDNLSLVKTGTDEQGTFCTISSDFFEFGTREVCIKISAQREIPDFLEVENV